MLPRAIALCLIGASACGRLHFDATSTVDADPGADADGALALHDEDGDTVPDVLDVCPSVADNQADGDGDGVGDACDPEPAQPRQHRSYFNAMVGPDPRIGFYKGPGIYTQLADAWEIDATVTNEGLSLFEPLGTTDIRAGFDVLAVGAGARQLAVISTGGAFPQYYGAVYDSGGAVVSLSSCTTASSCGSVTQQVIASFPIGRVDIHLATSIAGSHVATFDLGGSGFTEPAATPGSTAQTEIGIDVEQISAQIRYLEIIQTQ